MTDYTNIPIHFVRIRQAEQDTVAVFNHGQGTPSFTLNRETLRKRIARGHAVGLDVTPEEEALRVLGQRAGEA